MRGDLHLYINQQGFESGQRSSPVKHRSTCTRSSRFLLKLLRDELSGLEEWVMDFTLILVHDFNEDLQGTI